MFNHQQYLQTEVFQIPTLNKHKHRCTQIMKLIKAITVIALIALTYFMGETSFIGIVYPMRMENI
jgi:hypothetical protein